MDPVFPSKRDAWIVAVIWLSVASLMAGAGVMFASPGPLAARGALAAFMLGSCALSLSILRATRYSVTATQLDVRSGPFRWRVALAAIASIVPSNSPLSSPAVSLDRLRVAHRDANGRERAILLSPADKAGFLAAVAARCPALVLAGDRLVPRA